MARWNKEMISFSFDSLFVRLIIWDFWLIVCLIGFFWLNILLLVCLTDFLFALFVWLLVYFLCLFQVLFVCFVAFIFVWLIFCLRERLLVCLFVWLSDQWRVIYFHSIACWFHKLWQFTELHFVRCLFYFLNVIEFILSHI